MLYEHNSRGGQGNPQFEACRGREDLKGLAYALLGRLEQRCKPEAIRVFHDFIEHGRLPEQTPGALPKPVSTRKPIAPSDSSRHG
ncbi:hypothetical protein BZM27_34815 [Paraburkholderia steynii]|uniref:Uncharacterized protein n=1 Tax=Paraburkholderia steynii TaxID=1245441 RepID=A0A4R0X549_9BURK|nr:hypothetical protein BZM27_34815 [Paraburkholderia steynii]